MRRGVGRWRSQLATNRHIRSVERACGRKSFKSVERRLLSGKGSLSSFRNAISAAGSRFMSAVGYKRFSPVKPESVVRPEYFATHSIRNIDHAVAVQGDHACLPHVKIGVVPRHDGIISDRGLQFTGGFNAARDH
jgi:hypothetical protein